MSSSSQKKQVFPPQNQQRQPGIESEMTPPPVFETEQYKAAGKLVSKTALLQAATAALAEQLQLHTPRKARRWLSLIKMNTKMRKRRVKSLKSRAGAVI